MWCYGHSPAQMLCRAGASTDGRLGLYVWLVLSRKPRGPRPMHEPAAAPRPHPAPAKAIAARYVAEGRSSWARPTFNGLGSLGEGDRVHVVVHPKPEVGAARA